jgi:ABC-type amino acid transport substrate-binding protein
MSRPFRRLQVVLPAALLVLLAATPSPAAATPSDRAVAEGTGIELTATAQAKLAEHPVIRVGLDAYWPPFQFVLGDAPTGLSVDLLERLARDLGVALEWVPSDSFSRLLGMLERGEVDMLTSLYINPERRRRFLFSRPYLRTHLALITRDDPAAPTDLTALGAGRVAMQRNDGAVALIRDRAPTANLVLYEDELDMLMALGTGGVDAVVGAALPLLYLAETNHIVGLRVAEYIPDRQGVLGNTSLHFGVRQDWPWLRDALDAALAALPGAERAALEQSWTQGLVSSSARPTPDLNDDERAFLAGLGRLRVCTVPDWLPYSKVTAEGEHLGMSAGISELLAEELALPVEQLKTTTWPDSLQLVREGRCDLLPIVMDVPSRRDYIRFSKPYTRQPFAVASRRDAPFLQSLAEITPATLSIVRGYAQGELIRADYPGIRLRPVANALEGLRLTRRGEVAGHVDSLATISYRLQVDGWTDLKVAGVLDFDLELSVGTRADAPLLASAVDKVLARAGEERIHRLVMSSLSVSHPSPFDKRLAIQILAPILLVLIGFYLWNRRLRQVNQELALARSKLEEQAESMARLASTDPLTGLDNRRKLDEDLRNDDNALYSAKESGRNRVVQAGD